jgi:membrane protease YdiL (CAAX protease family)
VSAAASVWSLAISHAAIGAVLPVVLLVAASSMGGWSPRLPQWTGRSGAVAASCALVVVAVTLVMVVVGALVSPSSMHPINRGSVATVAGVCLLLVPLQATAEESVFRGYLVQAFGAYLAVPSARTSTFSMLERPRATNVDQGRRAVARSSWPAISATSSMAPLATLIVRS